MKESEQSIFESQIEALEEANEILTDKIGELEKQLDNDTREMKKALENLTTDVESLQKQNETLEREIIGKNQHIGTIEQAKDALVVEIKTLEEQKQTIEQEIIKKDQYIASIEEEKETIVKDLTICQERESKINFEKRQKIERITNEINQWKIKKQIVDNLIAKKIQAGKSKTVINLDKKTSEKYALKISELEKELQAEMG